MDSLTDDQRYAATAARDARFDGVFFTCVQSTGIFCRPSCPARTPRRGGVEFAPSAPAAVALGYRACKRCGPLAPPGSADSDPAASLAARALRLIGEGALDDGPDGSAHVADLARRLHVSERTLHRALLAGTGAGAIAHARMARARRAHELLRTTGESIAAVATAAGFGSERQMHETLTRIYNRSPSLIREGARVHEAEQSPKAEQSRGGNTTESAGDGGGGVVTAELAVRHPFDGKGLASWFATRAIPGVEHLDGTHWIRAVHLPRGPAVLQAELGAEEGPLPLTVRLADLRDYPAAVAMARRMLDLDADPVGIDAGLAQAMPVLVPLIERRPGVRIPGTSSFAEALMWAIVGQQIATARARDLIIRATDLAGANLPAALRTDHVHRLSVRPGDAAATAGQWYRGPAARRHALVTALTAPLDADAPVDELRRELLARSGIGPWTADYALLRGVRAIDVAPPRDVALLAAVRDLGIADDLATMVAALEGAAPWRSYAAMHLWHHHSTLPAARPGRPRKDPR